MSFQLISVIIGSAIMIFGSISLATNIFVLSILWRGGLLKSKTSNSNIYIFAFANILGNCIQVGMMVFYLGPISILQNYLFNGGIKGFGNDFMTIMYQGAWFEDMLTTAIIAINRLFVIVFRNDRVFSRKVVIAISIMVFVVGYLLAIITYEFIPCCLPYISYQTYSLLTVDKGTNLSDYIVGLPINGSSSFISIVCYAAIFIYFKIHNNKVSNIGVKSVEAKRRQEIRLAIQFAALSLFALFAWVGLRIFPLIFHITMLEEMSSLTFAMIIHCSANSIIFLTINKEVKDCLKSLYKEGFFKKNIQAASVKVPTHATVSAISQR